MRAAIYARVSKDEDNSDSVAVQLRACRDLAKQRRLTVVAEHEDDGISGWSTGNRPGFLALMSAVRAGEVDVILFRDIERLARGPDLPVVCRQLEFHRCALLGLDKSDSSDASFRMRIGLSAIMSSEDDREGARPYARRAAGSCEGRSQYRRGGVRDTAARQSMRPLRTAEVISLSRRRRRA